MRDEQAGTEATGSKVVVASVQAEIIRGWAPSRIEVRWVDTEILRAVFVDDVVRERRIYRYTNPEDTMSFFFSGKWFVPGSAERPFPQPWVEIRQTVDRRVEPAPGRGRAGLAELVEVRREWGQMRDGDLKSRLVRRYEGVDMVDGRPFVVFHSSPWLMVAE